jgi:NDP-sugar pyrophosphorylase family protein
MQWPNHVFATALFPSFYNKRFDGFVPDLPHEQPIWEVLLDQENGLKNQLSSKLTTSSNAPPHCTIDSKEGPVHIDSSAKIEPGVHFIGPCYIGPNATIRQGAYIRQYAWICDGAIVGHCSEIKHSILLPGAQAPHFNYVGDSILGGRVNLGAGVKLSNLRNDGTEVILRIGDKTHASGLRKFGAILGEDCALGCNTVTNPGVVLGRGSIVKPNMTVTGIHPDNTSM